MNIEERVGRIDENLDLLRRELLQSPGGRLPRLEDDVDELKSANAHRMGAMSVLSVVASAATTWLIEKLRWH